MKRIEAVDLEKEANSNSDSKSETDSKSESEPEQVENPDSNENPTPAKKQRRRRRRRRKNLKEESQEESSENPQEDFSIEPSFVQRAFSNALVVRKILSCSSAEDLLNFRLISKTFEEEATSLILSHPTLSKYFQVKFSFDDITLEYEHVYLGNLKEFSGDCLSKSRRFPTWNFCFEHGDLGLTDSSRFLRKYGKNIKGLVIDPETTDEIHCMTSPKTMRSILFDWLPNLKHLTFISTPWPSEYSLFDSESDLESPPETEMEPEPEMEEPEEPEVEEVTVEVGSSSSSTEPNTVLPSLESLTLEGSGSVCSTGIIQDILNSAPNLKLVKDPQFRYTELLLSAGKFPCSSKIIYWKFDRDHNERFTRFTRAGPRVTDIELQFRLGSYEHETWPEVARSINALFRTSQFTLERMKIPFLQCLPDIELPSMLKVYFIRFYQHCSYHTRGREKFLPNERILNECFPNLETIGLYQLKNDPESNPLFNIENFHDKVKTLEVAAEYPDVVQPIWIEKSRRVFPNVIQFEIQIQGMDSFPGICKAIWKHFPLLESLNFYLNTPSNILGHKLPGEMDSAITGIPLEVCKQLRRNLRTLPEGEYPEIEVVNSLREYPSILNLKKLKTLKIEIWNLVNKFEEFFTPVSTLYGFRPMWRRQGLKVFMKSTVNISYEIVKGVCGAKTTDTEFLIVE